MSVDDLRDRLAALERDLPTGEHFGQRPAETGCGLPNSAATAGEAQLSGQYTAWHAERDWREAATASAAVALTAAGLFAAAWLATP